MLQQNNNRATHPPRQRDIFGGQAEEALRNWLAERIDLAETRILAYEERRGKRAITKYRELDALVLEDRRRAWVFEVKASRKIESLRRAFLQLRETRTILRLLYPQVSSTILLVDTGICEGEKAEAETATVKAEPSETAPCTLEELLAQRSYLRLIHSLDERSTDSSSDTVDLLCFSVDDIIAMVGAENLALDWEADEEAEAASPAPPDSRPAYSTGDADDTDDDTDTDNPLAAALRRAGLSNE
jgi:hypothetical protein